MDLLADTGFQAWAAAHGLDFTPQAPGARDLVALPPPRWPLRWTLPAPQDSADFLFTLLQGLGLEAPIVAWRAGAWLDYLPPMGGGPPAVLADAGVVPGYRGAIRIAWGTDNRTFVPLLQEACYWSPAPDDALYLVPEHGGWVLQATPDRSLVVTFRDSFDAATVGAAMAAAGYPPGSTGPAGPRG